MSESMVTQRRSSFSIERAWHVIASLSMLALVTGCQSIEVTKPQEVPEVARYDFGRLSGPWNFSGFPISGVEVKAVPWLDTPAFQYRREFDDGWRRYTYRDSQWVAPPGALLERFLTRRILFRQPDPNGHGCHLSFLLYELEQTYSTAQTGHVTLEVLGLLLPQRDAKPLAKRAFYITKETRSADARGAVAATREALQSLSVSVDEWLAEIESERPAIANRCRTS